MLDDPASVVSASSAAAAAPPPPSSTVASAETTEKDVDPIKIVFSDLDGTLIHYPSEKRNITSKLLKFPPSSTGKIGVISKKTLKLVDQIRNKDNVKFVLISGMRTSTLLQRLPYLPKADAYCSENGGRIFYPVKDLEDDDGSNWDMVNDDVFWVQPKEVESGDPNRNKPFGIREDKVWREKMTKAIGGDSFGPSSLLDIYIDHEDPELTSLPLNERDGLLWDFARDLIDNHGLVLDTKGYSTCFRFNKKQQTSDDVLDIAPSEILELLDGPLWNENKASIASSVNLNCVDFYPSFSGKKNCCLYLASKFFPKECKLAEDVGENTDTGSDGAEESFLSKYAVCMCDDDNDLEMALACHHAYLPDVASQSMRDTVDKFPDHFTTTFRVVEEGLEEGEYIVETDASDLALSIIREKTFKEELEAPPKKRIISSKKIVLALSCVALFLYSDRLPGNIEFPDIATIRSKLPDIATIRSKLPNVAKLRTKLPDIATLRTKLFGDDKRKKK